MATQFAVDLVFKSQTKSLNDIQRKLQQLEANLNKIKGGKPFKPIEDGAGRANVKVGGLVKTLGKLALAYGALKAGQAAISAGISRIESERRIQFLAQSYGEAAQLAQAAANAARKFGVSQTEANEALATTYARLRPVGVSLQEIEGIYAGFSTAARISGASATEAEGAFRQLAQGLGSGALRGDEFNSVAEQVPLILTAVSKETGIAQGALRDYAAEGKITSDVVIRALKRIEREGADQLEAALDGPQQKIKNFQNASEDLAVAFSRELIPEMTGAISELAQTLRDLIPILRAIGRVAAAVFKYIGGLARRINDMMNGAKMAQAELQADAQAQKQTREKYGVLGSLSGEAQDYRARVKAAQLAAARDALNPIPQLSTAAAPSFGGGAIPAGGGGGSKTGGKKAGKSEREKQLEREAKLLQRMGEQFASLNQSVLDGNYAYAERLNTQQRLNALLLEGFSPEKAQEQVQFETEVNRLQRERAQTLAELRGIEGITQDKLVTGEQTINQAFDQRIRSLYEEKQLKDEILERTEAQKKAEEELNAQRQIGVDALNSAGSQIAGTLDTLIQGTDDWNKVLQNTLRSLSSMLLKFGIKALAGTDGEGLFSFLDGSLKGFASGGRPPVGKPSIVGERGPELFVPGTSGTIIPNDALGGGTTVNITLNGVGGGSSTGSGPNQEEAARLARMVEAATVGVIQRERRPGGLLAR